MLIWSMYPKPEAAITVAYRFEGGERAKACI
jgi:hypothetical protein